MSREIPFSDHPGLVCRQAAPEVSGPTMDVAGHFSALSEPLGDLGGHYRAETHALNQLGARLEALTGISFGSYFWGLDLARGSA